MSAGTAKVVSRVGEGRGTAWDPGKGHPWPAALLAVYASKQQSGHLMGVSVAPVSNKVCAEVLQHSQSLL